MSVHDDKPISKTTRWWTRWRLRRERRIELLIIGALHRCGDLWSLQLSAETGLRPGKLYPAIVRLERGGEIWSYWEDMPPPRRRHYRLTEKARAAEAA